MGGKETQRARMTTVGRKMGRTRSKELNTGKGEREGEGERQYSGEGNCECATGRTVWDFGKGKGTAGGMEE